MESLMSPGKKHLMNSQGFPEPSEFRLVLIPLTTMRIDDFVLNIAMTLPLAALLHLVFGVTGKARVVLIGFLLSVVIETTQAMLVISLQGHRWADVNDLIANTLGALFGYLLYRRLLQVESFRRVAENGSLVPAERRAPKPVR